MALFIFKIKVFSKCVLLYIDLLDVTPTVTTYEKNYHDYMVDLKTQKIKMYAHYQFAIVHCQNA